MNSDYYRSKSLRRAEMSIPAILVGLLLSATPILAQGDRPGRRGTEPTPSSKPSGIPSDSWPVPLRPSPRAMPPSSVVEINASKRELRENLELMATINDELLRIASASDYQRIITDASDITKLANRLLRSFAAPRTEKPRTSDNPAPVASRERLNESVGALDVAIKALLSNPVLNEDRTIDAGGLDAVGSDLETVISSSLIVRRCAEKLGASAVGKASSGSKPVRSRLKPRFVVLLNLECSAWSINDLVNKPAEVTGHGSIDILKVKAQTRRHKLAQQLVVPIDDCVDSPADEATTTGEVQYAAIIKDFISYEVKGKVFAYQVTYQVWLMKNGQITTRLPQPIWFYYVDEDGSGVFDLFRGTMPLGFVPDWAKDLARER